MKCLTATLCLFAVGCSSAFTAPDPTICADDGDCPQGQTCNLNRFCVEDQREPLRLFGLQIQETAVEFQAEVDGCDNEVDGGLIERSDLAQVLALSVSVQRGDGQDPQPLPSTFSLTQRSRFSPSATFQLGGLYGQTEEGPAEREFEWPRYHPGNQLPEVLGANGFILWEIVEASEAVPEGPPEYHMLMPPVVDSDRPCTESDDSCDCISEQFCRAPRRHQYSIIHNDSCERDLKLPVRAYSVEGSSRSVPEDLSARMRHLDIPGRQRLGRGATGPTNPEQCESDDDCLEGEQFCDEGQCKLALAGRSAGESRGDQELDAASPQVTVPTYLYCDDNPDLLRGYTVDLDSAFPTMTFEVSVPYAEITPQNLLSNFRQSETLTDNLCVFDWGLTESLRMQLSGEPVTLASGYSCCDTGCLPQTDDDTVERPETSESTCSGRTSTGVSPSLSLETPLHATDAMRALWINDCLEPVLRDGTIVSDLRRTATCSDDSPQTCDFTDLAPDADYRLRIESPVGSVLRSIEVPVTLPDVTGSSICSLDPTTNAARCVLPPRTIVRGSVTLPAQLCEEADDDCVSEGAIVMAERLRVPEDGDTSPPGPYFHEVSTYYDPEAGRNGQYVLPLDPGGVYVMTALPAQGSRGGPAPFKILDLSTGEDLGQREVNFELEEGTSVTVDLRSFDRRAQVVPLDRASWEFPVNLVKPDGSALDLNGVDECYTDPAGGCRIRRLTPGTSLPLTQARQVVFLSRSGDGSARQCNFD